MEGEAEAQSGSSDCLESNLGLLVSCFSLETAAATVIVSHLFQVHYDEFIPQFEKQYPEFPWSGVQVSLRLRQAGAMKITLFPGWTKTTPPTHHTPAVL